MDAELYHPIWGLPRHLSTNKIPPRPMDLRLHQIRMVQPSPPSGIRQTRCSIFLLIPTSRVWRRLIWRLLARQSINWCQRRRETRQRWWWWWWSATSHSKTNGPSRYLVPAHHSPSSRCSFLRGTNSPLGTTQKAR